MTVPVKTLQAVLFFRLGYPAAKWRNVYKGLTVLDFLLKRGSDQARGRELLLVTR